MSTGKRVVHVTERIAPTWLSRSDFVAILAIYKDVLIEGIRQGTKARFPSEAPADGLAALGRDRQILRGLWESDESYRVRLANWRKVWALTGHAFGVIESVLGYLSGGSGAWVRVINSAGLWWYGDDTGTRSWSRSAWDWDGTVDLTRYWVIFYPGGLFGAAPLFGTVQFGVGCWGLDAPEELGLTIRALCRRSAPLWAVCDWIVVALDPTSFVPGGPGLPAGDWGPWYDRADPARAPVRLASARYIYGH